MAARSQQLRSCHVIVFVLLPDLEEPPVHFLKIFRCTRVRACSNTRRIVRSTVSASRRNSGTST
ncbi:hypothetical protein DPMN_066510 [Dreissena polymorpha]|uniref:Uncharacterized protein n=1 Tax=Dreissena polymorpha TaxID=45954 RepID=A0A9D3YU56_DREPO|nr:hypothetical protein DPMN_066510 [Dreissena polymorpha]